MRMKFLFVDDHKIVAEALSQFIKSQLPDAVVIISNSKQEALQILTNTNDFDFIFSDLNFNGVFDGFDFLKEAKKVVPEKPFIVLSMHSEPAIMQKALESGACAYISKSDSPKSLFEAIASIQKNEVYISESCRPVLENGLHTDGSLSSREQEIAVLVTKGLNSKEIAGKLQISHRTVEVHRRNLMKKMGVQNTAQMVQQLKML